MRLIRDVNCFMFRTSREYPESCHCALDKSQLGDATVIYDELTSTFMLYCFRQAAVKSNDKSLLFTLRCSLREIVAPYVNCVQRQVI